MQSGPGIFSGKQSEERDWVALGSTRNVHSRSGLTAGISHTKVNSTESLIIFIYLYYMQFIFAYIQFEMEKLRPHTSDTYTDLELVD